MEELLLRLSNMARIPLAVQLLTTGKPKDLQKLLIAAILRSEDELLTITEADLAQAEFYTLVTTDIVEEKAIVLTTRLK